MTQVTRFDVFARPANEAEGLDEREVVRLFDKRKLVGEFDVEDIVRGTESDADWTEALTQYIKFTKDGKPLAAPRTLEAVVDFLGTDEAEEEGDEEPGSIVPEKYRVLYGSEQNCGDEVAVALTDYVTTPRTSRKENDGGLDRDKLREVARANGIADRLANWEDRGLNGGCLRMNTANVIRGMVRRGERVEIGQQVWEAREVEKKPRKRKNKAA